MIGYRQLPTMAESCPHGVSQCPVCVPVVACGSQTQPVAYLGMGHQIDLVTGHPVALSQVTAHVYVCSHVVTVRVYLVLLSTCMHASSRRSQHMHAVSLANCLPIMHTHAQWYAHLYAYH